MHARDLFDLTGRTALITGGSRGLGLQIAEALGDMGARLIISSRKEAGLREAKAHLEARGATVDYIVSDNSKEEELVRLADEALGVSGRIDILVNNAGTTWSAPAEDHPLEAWDKLMNVNVRAVFVLSQQVAKRSMIPNQYGRILNIASTSGLQGGKRLIAYNASKGAVVNFTRGLAADWAPYGITVNALAPGIFPSKMTAGFLGEIGVEHFTRATPLRRLGDDQDLKGAALLLVSDAGKYITGQILAVDGGATAVGAVVLPE